MSVRFTITDDAVTDEMMAKLDALNVMYLMDFSDPARSVIEVFDEYLAGVAEFCETYAAQRDTVGGAA
jgi:hypothetical protein